MRLWGKALATEKGNEGERCGAVTGAFMLIGLKYGMIRPEEVPKNKGENLWPG